MLSFLTLPLFKIKSLTFVTHETIYKEEGMVEFIAYIYMAKQPYLE